MTLRLHPVAAQRLGDALRRNKGDVNSMMKAVQASLLHSNSSDERPHHHLCPEGDSSWCKWQVAAAKGETYHHKKPPIPDSIMQLLRPIYNRLGSRSLLEKCVDGYTQNANESLHSVVWKLCPKELFLGKVNVDIACGIAVCLFNDGAQSLVSIANHLDLQPSLSCTRFLRRKDRHRRLSSQYKCSDRAKILRRRARERRKGLGDALRHREGVMYAPGACDSEEPSQAKTA